MTRNCLPTAHLTGALAIVAAVALGQPSAAQGPPDAAVAGPGERVAIPGARGIDHAGFVVPDLDQAVTFFVDALGAAVLWRAAPPMGSDADARAMFDAAPGASPRLAVLRLGPSFNVEFLEWAVPGQSRTNPPSSAVGVGHLAFDVADMDAAVRYLRGKGVRMLRGPLINRSGPNAGQTIWYFLTPWGMPVELVQTPVSMPYESETEARLFRTR